MLPRYLATIFSRMRRGRVLLFFLLFILLPVVIITLIFTRSTIEDPETINRKIMDHLNRVAISFQQDLSNLIFKVEYEVERTLAEVSSGREMVDSLEASCSASHLVSDFFLIDDLGQRWSPFGSNGESLESPYELTIREGISEKFINEFEAGNQQEFAERNPDQALKKYKLSLQSADDDLIIALTLHSLARIYFKIKNYPEAASYYNELYNLSSPPVFLGGLSLDLVALLQLARIENIAESYERTYLFSLDILEELLRGRLAGSIEEASFFAAEAIKIVSDLSVKGLLSQVTSSEFNLMVKRWRRKESFAWKLDSLLVTIQPAFQKLLSAPVEEGERRIVISRPIEGVETVIINRLLDMEVGGRFVLGIFLDPSLLKDELRNLLVKTVAVEGDVSLVVYDGQGDEVVWGGSADVDSRFQLVRPLAPSFPFWKVELTYPRRGFLLEIVRQERRNRLGYISFLMIIIFLGIYVIYRLNKKDTELSRLKSDFISRVSHELRTPLATIRAVGEMLEMGAVSSREKEKEYFGFITSESARLSRLIDNVLDFSRIGVNKRKYNISPGDLGGVVLRTVEAFREYSGVKEFNIVYQSDEDIPSVAIDEDAVGRALINILHNAVKFSRADKTILVELHHRGQELFLSVSDYGIGIDREEVGRIFEEFYQSSSGLSLARKGAGLGLAIVKHIIEAHGGRIDVESRPGEGTTFTLVFSVLTDTSSRRERKEYASIGRRLQV